MENQINPPADPDDPRHRQNTGYHDQQSPGQQPNNTPVSSPSFRFSQFHDGNNYIRQCLHDRHIPSLPDKHKQASKKIGQLTYLISLTSG